jgi:hypothetical protein
MGLPILQQNRAPAQEATTPPYTYVFRYLQGRNGLHADHHIAAERPGRPTLEVGLVHWHVFALFGTLEWDPRIHQRSIVGETATDQKGHRIFWPILRHVRYFLFEPSVAVNGVSVAKRKESKEKKSFGSLSNQSITNHDNTVSNTNCCLLHEPGYIGPQICPGCNSVWIGRANIAHLNEGTSPWVALAKEEKVKGNGALWQDDQIALKKPRTNPVGRFVKISGSNRLSKGLRKMMPLVQPGSTVPVRSAFVATAVARAVVGRIGGSSSFAVIVAPLRTKGCFCCLRILGDLRWFVASSRKQRCGWVEGLLHVSNIDFVVGHKGR